MKGVKFDGLHSYYEWGLILAEKELKSPDIKTHTVEIEGSNGVLDFTDFFGAVKYENRKLSFKFIKTNIVPDGFLSLYSLVQETLHGKKMQVILDDDPAYFYYGRVSINDWKSNKGIGEIVIEVDAEPFKGKVQRSSHLASLCGKNLINLDTIQVRSSGTWTKIETGYSYVRGSTVINSYGAFIVPLQAGKTYTLSANRTIVGDIPPMIIYKDRLYGTIVARGSDSVTFTPEETAYYAIALIANSSTEAITFSNLMLAEESTVGEYEPYTSSEHTISTFLENLKMPSVPDIYSMEDVTLTNGEETYVAKAGEILHQEEFELKEGLNQFNITGTGVVVFDWQEGGL